MERNLFKTCLDAIRKQYSIETDIENTINKYASGDLVLDSFPTEVALFKVLETELNDKSDLIQAYLYEDVDKLLNCTDNQPFFFLDDDDDLYDYLTIMNDDFDPAFSLAEKLVNTNDELTIMNKYTEILKNIGDLATPDANIKNHKGYNLRQMYMHIKITSEE